MRPFRLQPAPSRPPVLSGHSHVGLFCAVLALAFGLIATPPFADAIPSAQPAAQSSPPLPATVEASSPHRGKARNITEDELKQMLLGKHLYLRGDYLGDSLSFNVHGALIDYSPQGSYTLCGVVITKVHLSKHKLRLEGIRYGLHFLGAMPSQGATRAVDWVRIMPKKKHLKISIDRERVVKPKKIKHKRSAHTNKQPLPVPSPPTASQAESHDAVTTSPAHAAMVLRQAIHNVFAQDIDARMIAAMPRYWRLYYQAAAAHRDFLPTNPAVQSQDSVDRKAKLLTIADPGSNEYAQTGGVAGMALYHVIVGPNGRAQEIAIARPIGFGLDANAVSVIRKAKFQPALKNDKPVPVLLNLVVEFRIYSKLTSKPAPPSAANKSAQPSLPGPYSVEDRH